MMLLEAIISSASFSISYYSHLPSYHPSTSFIFFDFLHFKVMTKPGARLIITIPEVVMVTVTVIIKMAVTPKMTPHPSLYPLLHLTLMQMLI